MDNLRNWSYNALPEDCPFVVGGGLIRDSLLGGRPSDIDIWLPSNILDPFRSVEQFCSRLAAEYQGADIQILFRGPDHNGLGATAPDVAPGDSDYGDVANHWVVEMQIEGWPRVNFMRSMARWGTEGGAQAFFNGLMRAFDIDHCMFFIGWARGQRDVNTVILPRHMTQRDTRRFRLSELHWNQYRADRTSAARVEARIVKMMSKYMYAMRTPSEIFTTGYVIPVDQIIAQPMYIQDAMRLLNRHAPLPTYQNQREPLPGDEVINGRIATQLANRIEFERAHPLLTTNVGRFNWN